MVELRLGFLFDYILHYRVVMRAEGQCWWTDLRIWGHKHVKEKEKPVSGETGVSSGVAYGGGWVLIGLLQAYEADCINAREERRHARRMQFGVHVSRSTSFVFG